MDQIICCTIQLNPWSPRLKYNIWFNLLILIITNYMFNCIWFSVTIREAIVFQLIYGWVWVQLLYRIIKVGFHIIINLSLITFMFLFFVIVIMEPLIYRDAYQTLTIAINTNKQAVIQCSCVLCNPFSILYIIYK